MSQTKQYGPRPRIATRKPKGKAIPVLDARCTHDSCIRSGHGVGEYHLTGYCTNCGTEPITGIFTRGHEAGSGVLGRECPVCGCKRLGWRGPQ